MALAKKAVQAHQRALDLIGGSARLTGEEVDFCFENYHEAAKGSTRLQGAHFTPEGLARDLAANVEAPVYLDLFAGIGRLGRSVLDYHAVSRPRLICVEFNPDFVAAGRRLVPEAEWIEMDLLADDAFDRLAALTAGIDDLAIVSNPPYGRGKLNNGKSVQLEYHAIELGRAAGALLGAFIIPQERCPFRYSGGHAFVNHGGDTRYADFTRATGLRIAMNAGFDTEIHRTEWRTISPRVEIAIVDYAEAMRREEEDLAA